MGCLDGLRQFLNKLQRKKQKPKVIILDNNPLSISSYLEEHPEFDDVIPQSKQFDMVPSPRSTPKRLSEIKAVRKMRHGHQATWYRKSVKANIKPQEEED